MAQKGQKIHFACILDTSKFKLQNHSFIYVRLQKIVCSSKANLTSLRVLTVKHGPVEAVGRLIVYITVIHLHLRSKTTPAIFYCFFSSLVSLSPPFAGAARASSSSYNLSVWALDPSITADGGEGSVGLFQGSRDGTDRQINLEVPKRGKKRRHAVLNLSRRSRFRSRRCLFSFSLALSVLLRL